eukprot:1898635-Pyramimonas_sp.AAC.1
MAAASADPPPGAAIRPTVVLVGASRGSGALAARASAALIDWWALRPPRAARPTARPPGAALCSSAAPTGHPPISGASAMRASAALVD